MSSTLRAWLRAVAPAARLVGGLTLCIAASLAATLLLERSVLAVLALLGPGRLVIGVMATAWGIAQYRHVTQRPDEEHAAYLKRRAGQA